MSGKLAGITISAIVFLTLYFIGTQIMWNRPIRCARSGSFRVNSVERVRHFFVSHSFTWGTTVPVILVLD